MQRDGNRTKYTLVVLYSAMGLVCLSIPQLAVMPLNTA